MALKHIAYLALSAATALAPLAAHADGVVQREVRNGREVVDEAVTPARGPLRESVRLDDSVDVPLQTGCRYHATVRGTVRPVSVNRDLPADVQRLRPDVRVAATVRCPNSTESHIQERAVRSTGVTREEFEHLLSLNGSVQRMQNSGTCMYMPDFAFDNTSVHARDVRYLCPRDRGGARGGGPYIHSHSYQDPYNVR